jgi:hypothetical protein
VAAVAAVAGKRNMALNSNLFDIPASETREAAVLMTLFDGRNEYERTTD